MKKFVTIILAILACLTIVSCIDNGPSVVPPVGGGQETEQGGEVGKGEEETGGGSVVTPIRPGGNFNGDGYGK